MIINKYLNQLGGVRGDGHIDDFGDGSIPRNSGRPLRPGPGATPLGQLAAADDVRFDGETKNYYNDRAEKPIDNYRLNKEITKDVNGVYNRGDRVFHRTLNQTRKNRDLVNWESGYRIAKTLIQTDSRGRGSEKRNLKGTRHTKLIVGFYQEFLVSLLTVIVSADAQDILTSLRKVLLAKSMGSYSGGTYMTGFTNYIPFLDYMDNLCKSRDSLKAHKCAKDIEGKEDSSIGQRTCQKYSKSS